MGDHWNLLANKLGAPGVPQPEEKNAEAPVSERTESPRTESPRTESPRTESPRTESTRTESPRTESTRAQRTERSVIETNTEPTTSFIPPSPAAPEKVIPKTPVANVTKPVQEKREEPSKPVKARTSSWEKLASMFGVHVEPRSAPVEERPAHVEKDEEPQFQVFGGAMDAEANPALEAMFGEVPRGDLDSWSQPKRMVDDVDWDDEAPSAQEPIEETNYRPDTPTEVAAEERDEDRPRRRRRRRGRRGGGEGTAAKPRGEAWEKTEASAPESEEIESGDRWNEPESFEVAADLDAENRPERRSSRRRRRGGRSSESRTEESRGEASPSREAKVEGREPREPSEIREPREGREKSAGRQRDGRARSDRYEEGAAEKARRPVERPMPPSAGDLHDDDEGDDASAAIARHRNIPTWIDSLQAMIDANIENHQRNEGRGGPPRGRPRGRR